MLVWFIVCMALQAFLLSYRLMYDLVTDDTWVTGLAYTLLRGGCGFLSPRRCGLGDHSDMEPCCQDDERARRPPQAGAETAAVALVGLPVHPG